MKKINLNPKILDMYISKQIIFGLFIISAILLGIAWFSQVIRLLSYLVNNNLSFGTFLNMTMLLIPDLLQVIMPIALFTVVLFIYNKLISDKELIIMHATGLDIKALAHPALNVAMATTLISLCIALYISPIYAKKYRNFAFEAKNDLSALLIKEGEFNQITQGLTIYVKDSSNNVLTDLFINDARSSQNVRTILAQQGIITTTKNNISLSLKKGSMQENSNSKYTFGTFDTYTADLGVINTNSERNLKPSELGFFELIFARELGYSSKANYPKYLNELHKRVISPLYNIIFTLVALIAIFNTPLNKRNNSKSTLVAVMTALLIQMFYISAFNMIKTNPNFAIILYGLSILGIYILYRILYNIGKVKKRK